MKILIVDDEQDLCEILQYNLEKEGYAITTANSAEEALQLPLTKLEFELRSLFLQNAGRASSLPTCRSSSSGSTAWTRGAAERWAAPG